MHDSFVIAVALRDSCARLIISRTPHCIDYLVLGHPDLNAFESSQEEVRPDWITQHKIGTGDRSGDKQHRTADVDALHFLESYSDPSEGKRKPQSSVGQTGATN